MQRIFEVNVFGTTDCIHAAIPVMAKQDLRNGYRGQIMIVSSAAARRGLPFFGPYAATKAAQHSLAEALRVELKPKQIAVTSVHPVGTDTEFFGVAENQTGMRRPVSDTKVRQSAATVARKMARAIERPRGEVWPMRPSRWVLSLQTLIPGITDRVMGRYFRQIDELNRGRRE
jgi:short-subunit dehydrogenase